MQYEHAEFGFEANRADFISGHDNVLLSEKYSDWLIEGSNIVEDLEMARNIPCRSRVRTPLVLRILHTSNIRAIIVQNSSIHTRVFNHSRRKNPLLLNCRRCFTVILEPVPGTLIILWIPMNLITSVDRMIGHTAMLARRSLVFPLLRKCRQSLVRRIRSRSMSFRHMPND